MGAYFFYLTAADPSRGLCPPSSPLPGCRLGPPLSGHVVTVLAEVSGVIQRRLQSEGASRRNLMLLIGNEVNGKIILYI